MSPGCEATQLRIAATKAEIREMPNLRWMSEATSTVRALAYHVEQNHSGHYIKSLRFDSHSISPHVAPARTRKSRSRNDRVGEGGKEVEADLLNDRVRHLLEKHGIHALGETVNALVLQYFGAAVNPPLDRERSEGARNY